MARFSWHWRVERRTVVVSSIGILRRKHERLSIGIRVNGDGSNDRIGGFERGGGGAVGKVALRAEEVDARDWSGKMQGLG
jgi:hypothetical protein